MSTDPVAALDRPNPLRPHCADAHPVVYPTVSVVVPTRNEARNLEIILPALAGLRPALHEIIVVDGNSTDGSLEVARRVLPSVKTITQTRKGKGNAMACGFAAVTGDVVVMFDADGSADPAEIPRFVEALVAGADFAKGSRFAAGGGSDDITLLRKTGNFGLNGVANALFGTSYTDLCYGYNAFWADVLPVLELDGTPRSVAFNVQWFRVAVDPGTGEIRILRSVHAADAGRVLNPAQCRGQIEGGVAQALGAAQFEQILFDDAGRVTTTAFREYRLPAFADVPRTEVHFADTTDTIGPHGAKSMSESPFNPVAPALANAVRDATGVRFTDLPLARDTVWLALER